MLKIDLKYLKFLISLALLEDIKSGDITSNTLISASQKSKAKIISKGTGVLAGQIVAAETFKMVDQDIKYVPRIKDGKKVKPGEVVASLHGLTRGILAAERTALNFLQRLSGIATLTSRYVERVKPYKVKIMDTRKTTPALRPLEKYAVAVGGGSNHRFGLYDGVLIKDNHLKVLRGQGLSFRKIISEFDMDPVEVEVKNIKEAIEAAWGGADIIMLDNFSISSIKNAVKAIKRANPKIQIEASGGITLSNVKRIAATGVDRISVGALTHSPCALDLSLKIS